MSNTENPDNSAGGSRSKNRRGSRGGRKRAKPEQRSEASGDTQEPSGEGDARNTETPTKSRSRRSRRRKTNTGDGEAKKTESAAKTPGNEKKPPDGGKKPADSTTKKSDGGTKKPDSGSKPAEDKAKSGNRRTKSGSGEKTPDREKKPYTRGRKPSGRDSRPQKPQQRSSEREQSGPPRQTLEGDLDVTSKGFGFVQHTGGPDIFVHRDNLGTALEGDRVRVEVFPGKRKPAGRILDVVNRVEHPIVGVFRTLREGGGEIHPSDDRIVSSFRIPDAEIKRAGFGKKLRNNMVVKASFSEWHSAKEQPTARLESIIGKPNDAGIDVKIIALSRGLRVDFPEEVANAANSLKEPDMRKMKRKRLDLTDRMTFTIDPDDAKDFDDALSIRQQDNGLFEVGVHIADVTAWIGEDDVVDQEARRRATSVYFVKDVLPMLPERLSNDLCSLKPNVERLAYSCIVTVDSLGTIHGSEVRETVIRSDHRLTYTQAQGILEGRAHEVAPALHQLQLIARTLRARREETGSIDFDLPAPVITLDKEGLPSEITRSERSESQRLVEELMLLANRQVAESIFFSKAKKPFVYRVHERPSPEDVATLQTVLQNLGIPMTLSDEVAPEEFSRILDVVESLEVKDFVERIALRSMTKAVYSSENLGHFGLSFEAYTHFTSPIRRYADVVVHRLLKSYNSRFSRVKKSLRDQLQAICVECSQAELVAVDAERDYQRKKIMEFLRRKVGRSYRGVISGVSRYGMFVELKHYPIEGMVPIQDIGEDTFVLDEDNFRFVGQNNGESYRIGDPVRITIRTVDVDQRRAYFSLEEVDATME